MNGNRAGKRVRAVAVALAAALWLGAGGPVAWSAQAGTSTDAGAALAQAEKSQQARIEAIRRVIPTVISVFRVAEKTEDLAAGSGSGVIISADGFALSNYHVTEKFKELRVGLPGGKIRKARLWGVDRTGDISLIKIESDEPLPYAEMGSSGSLEIGQTVIAMGNPFMLATDFTPTVSMGVVSGLHRYLPGGGVMRQDLIYADAIQIDAALNPGNSGGPLFTLDGKLVGINGRISPRQVEGMRVVKLNAGIGFAIPIDAVRTFLDDLKAGHEVDRGFLGVVKVEKVDGGLKVEEISRDSPAELFGVKVGDIITSLDGTTIYGHGQMENMIKVKPAGTRVVLGLKRGDESLEKTVQLGGVQTTALLKWSEFRAGIQMERRRNALPTRPGTEPDATPSDPDENDDE